MIVIVGGTSSLGRATAAELLASGHRVRATCRHPEKATGLQGLGAEIRTLDLRNPAGFGPALEGATAVLATAHALIGQRSDSLRKVDRDGHMALIDECATRKIGRFVYTSALGASLDHPAPFWRTKAEVERRLLASGLPCTILRPAAFMDFHAHELIGANVIRGKSAPILGSGETKRNLVAVADVASVAARALTTPDFLGKTVEIGGPDNLTDREVAALYARLADRPLKVLAVPRAALPVLAAIVGPFHAGVGNVLRLARQLEGRSELMFDDAGMPGLIGRQPISVETFARERIAERA